MLLSCLIGKSKEGHLYDKFRNRIMFPIQDVRNRVIAFGGRNIVQKEKAIVEVSKNSPTTSN